MNKSIAVLLACVVLTGCATHYAIEAEHISHPTAGWPVEAQKHSEDELTQVVAILRWRGESGAYIDAGLGYKLLPYQQTGFYGPRLTGTVRVGKEWRVLQ